MVCSVCTDWEFLQTLYSEDDLHVMKEYGLDLHRVAVFIACTLIVGGTVAKVTLMVANTIRTTVGDPDANFVVCTFAYGATWESKEPAQYADVPNYVPDEYSSKMTSEVNKEWEAGRYVKADRNQVVGVAAMGIVVKDAKDRMVHDLTRPDQASVNSGITIEKRKFASVRQACSWLQPGGWQAKTDLSKAYRSIPTAPFHWRTHVLQWDGQVYADIRLPFGNRAAPGVFDRLTQTIVRTAQHKGVRNVLGYLDDFYVTVSPSP